MKKILLAATLACLLGLAPSLYADFEIEGLGFQYGIDAEDGAQLNSYEVMAWMKTPWEWSIHDAIELEFYLEGTAGIIDGVGETSGLVHLGLLAEIEIDDFPVSFLVGTGPTLLTEDEFDDYDMGSQLQFTSSIGFRVEIESFQLAYRYQHISNASIDETNPGLNMHVFSAIYEF
jgi:hypothetical protein